MIMEKSLYWNGQAPGEGLLTCFEQLLGSSRVAGNLYTHVINYLLEYLLWHWPQGALFKQPTQQNPSHIALEQNDFIKLDSLWLRPPDQGTWVCFFYLV